MVGRPRRNVIQRDRVGVYHCWNRCDRGSPLCGIDPQTGKNYEHRKGWIMSEVQRLAYGFAIDACVYAVLPNHYHLILRNRPDLVRFWSDLEVAEHWWWLCPERKNADGTPAVPKPIELQSIVAEVERIGELRNRLSDISWFMKFLNERTAKRANAEDQVTGRFWGDRFSCRNLLDEGAILACSVYVDLNEIRANLASTPEESTFTSAYQRILAKLHHLATTDGQSSFSREFHPEDTDFWLCPVHDIEQAPLLQPNKRESVGTLTAEARENLGSVHKRWRHGFLPVSLEEYLELVDWTGRNLIHEGRGAIDNRLSPILLRLGIHRESWLSLVRQFDRFRGSIGSPEAMERRAEETGRNWIQGIRRCREHFF